MKKAEVGVEFFWGFLPYCWIFLFSIINIQKNIELSSITYYALFSEKNINVNMNGNVLQRYFTHKNF